MIHTTVDAQYLPVSHRVRAGDTLGKVAHTYGISYQYLACINRIRNPNLIHVNQEIILPRPPAQAEQIKLIWPLKTGFLTSAFGPRRSGCHNGIDIAAAPNTPIYAAAKGRVIYSGKMRGYGNTVILNHNHMYNTVYAHNKTNLVRRGQWVKPGDKIATVGSTGHTTGPHLHFEIRANNVARDPAFYLPQPPNKISVSRRFLTRLGLTNRIGAFLPPRVGPPKSGKEYAYHG